MLRLFYLVNMNFFTAFCNNFYIKEKPNFVLRQGSVFLLLVGVQSFELWASWSQTTRATSCATPRYKAAFQPPLYFMLFVFECQPKLTKKSENNGINPIINYCVEH